MRAEEAEGCSADSQHWVCRLEEQLEAKQAALTAAEESLQAAQGSSSQQLHSQEEEAAALRTERAVLEQRISTIKREASEVQNLT